MREESEPGTRLVYLHTQITGPVMYVHVYHVYIRGCT